MEALQYDREVVERCLRKDLMRIESEGWLHKAGEHEDVHECVYCKAVTNFKHREGACECRASAIRNIWDPIFT